MISPDVLLKCAFLMTLLLADRTLKHGLFTTFKSNVLQQAASVFVTSTTANTTMPALKHVAKQPIPLRCNTVTIISLELDKITCLGQEHLSILYKMYDVFCTDNKCNNHTSLKCPFQQRHSSYITLNNILP